MRTLLSLFVLLVATAAQGAGPDPYNALVWNHANHEARNGKVDRKDWFEWWYYKVVVPESKDSFYFVYGIVNPWDLGKNPKPHSRAYVSFGSFDDARIIEKKFSPAEFHASYDSTLVEIAGNRATDRALSGSVDNASWDLQLEHDWSFNAMGWAMSKAWLFNIYWYPAAASARMSGQINYNGRKIVLDHAPAYQDRNWGTSFPTWWTWLVSNNFTNSPGTVLAAGGGRPKTGGIDLFEGVTIGLRHEGTEYTFRPVDGDPVRTNVKFGTWEVSARNHRGEEIHLSATAPRAKFMDLPFTTPQGQTYHDFETLRGHILVRLYKYLKLIAELDTDEGGIEYGSFDSKGLNTLFTSQVELR